ncbi:MAG: DUF4402 domain-containing protein [Bacteroidia bacterium]|nr:DUF4402 domain-containing protein [Bacteroidia bacterium]
MAGAVGFTVMVFGINFPCYAQVTASSSAMATIVTPMNLVKTTDLNFGNIANSATEGMVTLSPANVRTSSGGISLPGETGEVNTGTFVVSGAPGYTFTISLPSVATLIDDNSGHTMTVDSWTSNPSGTGALDNSGSQILNVGATLHVGPNQSPGNYISATPFQVTLHYN